MFTKGWIPDRRMVAFWTPDIASCLLCSSLPFHARTLLFSCPVICGDFLMDCLHTGPLVHLCAPGGPYPGILRGWCAHILLASRIIEPSRTHGVAALQSQQFSIITLTSMFTVCARFQLPASRYPGFGTEPPTRGQHPADIRRHPSPPQCRNTRCALGRARAALR
ncbi:hypothetical protein L227DRAFT_330032 [Lentinus tigrinus ALCF2SS1-6]|uniref:Uncharacterized protein n=1 Tax=Lentinus tigrinus ALCF2SS1-6 TaxID=1328759 RepID=A0A5C2SME9_9APHY|nr:hypothetical protein L227DRAFT_330032 [Lentinus tigrinus ALCF2SS1-6]